MYAKLIEGELVEAPYYMKIEDKEIFGYNMDSNAEMLLEDGYKPVADVPQPIGMIQPTKLWEEQEDQIVAKWVDTYVAPTLAEVKIQKKAEINQMRDYVEQSGFRYLGKIFDSDPISCQRISCAAQAMQVAPAVIAEGDPEPTITWTCQDNSTIDLSPQKLLGLVVALAAHSNSCHVYAKELKASVDSALTVDEVNAIIWEYHPLEVPAEEINSILTKE